MEKNEPIPLFVLFGPNKNPYAGTEGIADHSEFFALGFLASIYHSVKRMYGPALDIKLLADDVVVINSNSIKEEVCQKYLDSVRRLIKKLGFADIFSEVVQYREAYTRLHVSDFFETAEKHVGAWESDLANSEALLNYRKNAGRHVVFESQKTDAEKEEEIKKATHSFLVYRKAEEMAGIRNGDSALCATYSLYPETLHFYSLKKGHITQPWQGRGAVLYSEEGLLPYCISQQRLKKVRTREIISLEDLPKGLSKIEIVENI